MSNVADKLRAAADAMGPEVRAIALVISGDFELCGVDLGTTSGHLTDEGCAEILTNGLYQSIKDTGV